MKFNILFTLILSLVCFLAPAALAGGTDAPRMSEKQPLLKRVFDPAARAEHLDAKSREAHILLARQRAQQGQTKARVPAVQTPTIDSVAVRRCPCGKNAWNACGPCCKPKRETTQQLPRSQPRPAPVATESYTWCDDQTPRDVDIYYHERPLNVRLHAIPAPVNVQRIQQAAPRQQLRGSICGNTCNGSCGQHQSTHTVQQTTQSRIIAVYKWHDGRCWNRVWTHNGPDPSSAQVDAFIVSNPNRVFGNRHSYDSFVATARSNSTVRNVAATPTRTTGYTGQQAHSSRAAVAPVQNLSPPIAGNIWGVRPPNAY